MDRCSRGGVSEAEPRTAGRRFSTPATGLKSKGARGRGPLTKDHRGVSKHEGQSQMQKRSSTCIISTTAGHFYIPLFTAVGRNARTTKTLGV